MFRLHFAFIGLTLSLLASSHAFAEIYKTVDKNGRITYSDTPPPNTNAQPIELKSLNITPPPPVMPNTTPSVTSAAQDAPDYQVQLSAPANGTTLLPNERSVVMTAKLTQGLQNNDSLAYKIDGNTIIKTTELSYTLDEPPRGEHSLSVDVIDENGETLAQSDAVTLIVMRPLPKRAATPVPKK